MSDTLSDSSASISKMKGYFQEYRYIVAAALVLLGLIIMLINMLTGLTPKMAKLMSDHKEAKIDMTALNRPIGDFSSIIAPYTPPIDDNMPAPEFKTRGWVIEHGADWTLQIMNVDSERLIKEYLQKRKDRQQFYYFKIEQDGSSRFLLVYRLFLSKDQAEEVRQQVQFDLPDNVQAFVESMSSYVGVLPTEAPKVVKEISKPVNTREHLPVNSVSEMVVPMVGTEKGDDIPVINPLGNTSDAGTGQSITSRDTTALPKEPTIKEALRKSFREKISEKLKAPDEKAIAPEPKNDQADLPAVSDPF